MKIPKINCSESLLTAYVSEPKNDGACTLALDNAETLALWDKIDAQTAALKEAIRQLKMCHPNWRANQSRADLNDFLDAARRTLQVPAPRPSNGHGQPRREDGR